jgi:2,4-dienoyl-CoA reductase-like NADH-dependent reductase (Old Yellow Enzyme family)
VLCFISGDIILNCPYCDWEEDLSMSVLFEKAELAGLTLRNRIVKSATVENMATVEGAPTAEMIALYKRLGRGGAGLIVTGFAYVNRAGQLMPLQSGCHEDEFIPQWREVTNVVHEEGAAIAIQLGHGGRQTNPKLLGGRQPIAPSAIPNLFYFTRPRAMTENEIWQTIRDFGNVASRAKEAGFDAVQLHAGHGYLISGFLSPLTNRRKDD